LGTVKLHILTTSWMSEGWKDAFYIRDTYYITRALNIKSILGSGVGSGGGGGGGRCQCRPGQTSLPKPAEDSLYPNHAVPAV